MLMLLRKKLAPLKCLTILFGVILFSNLVKAQGKFSLELSGGPSNSFLNGFRFDFGWKLPLNILNKQKKLALRN